MKFLWAKSDYMVKRNAEIGAITFIMHNFIKSVCNLNGSKWREREREENHDGCKSCQLYKCRYDRLVRSHFYLL